MPQAFCENEGCDNGATEVVPISVSEKEIGYRRYCHTCCEAYQSGAQHGHFRAIRQLRAIAAKVEMEDECNAEAIRQAIAKLNCGLDPGEEGLERPDLAEVDD